MAAPMGLLHNRLALVTGGGSGIGKAICSKFLGEGAKLAVADVNMSAAEETAKELSLSTDSPVYPFKVDVSSSRSVSTLFEEVRKVFFANPAVVVNSAGITKDNFISNMDEDSFDEVIRVNLKGTFLITQAACRAMVEEKLTGSVVNISSIVGKVGNLGQANYSASKAGVIGLTKTAAKEYAGLGIRCNSIMPGFIETPMTESVPQKVIEKVLPLIPLRRLGRPQEVADACLFLASDLSQYITGANIEVTGGLYM